MPSSATVTGKTGPDRQIIALVLTNVTTIELDLNHQVLRITSDRGITEFDMRIATTFTDTISQGNHTVVVT